MYKPILNIDNLKNLVITRRCNGNYKIGNLLAKALISFEKSQITKDFLIKYVKELKSMQK